MMANVNFRGNEPKEIYCPGNIEPGSNACDNGKCVYNTVCLSELLIPEDMLRSKGIDHTVSQSNLSQEIGNRPDTIEEKTGKFYDYLRIVPK